MVLLFLSFPLPSFLHSFDDDDKFLFRSAERKNDDEEGKGLSCFPPLSCLSLFLL